MLARHVFSCHTDCRKEDQILAVIFFSKEYGEDQLQYITSSNYDSLPSSNDPEKRLKRQREIIKLISSFSTIIAPSSYHDYIKHQWNAHQNVPLWVSIKAMTFGNTSKMFSLCYSKIQSDVAKEFPNISAGELAGMLDMLALVRNVCAHNERLYEFSVKNNRAIQDLPAHAALGIAKTSAGLYKQGKKDLFASLICLKYLLNPEDFEHTIMGIDSALSSLFNKTKQIPPNKILSSMGFPQNWKDVKN